MEASVFAIVKDLGSLGVVVAAMVYILKQVARITEAQRESAEKLRQADAERTETIGKMLGEQIESTRCVANTMQATAEVLNVVMHEARELARDLMRERTRGGAS